MAKNLARADSLDVGNRINFPVPGGIGSVTAFVLACRLIEAAEAGGEERRRPACQRCRW